MIICINTYYLLVCRNPNTFRMPSQKNLPSHYGPCMVTEVVNDDHLLMIIDELGDELRSNIEKTLSTDNKHSFPSGFYHNRISIIDAYKQRRLFGLTVVENDEMYVQKGDNDSRANHIYEVSRDLAIRS
jgi:hypothetical protein